MVHTFTFMKKQPRQDELLRLLVFYGCALSSGSLADYGR